MNRKKFLTENEIATIFYQVVQGLKHIHSKGIILRDLKPENVLIDVKTLNVKLCDFGWATKTDDLKWILNKAGTYVYMSPESLKGNF